MRFWPRFRRPLSATTRIAATLFGVLVLLAGIVAYTALQEADRFRSRASSDALQRSREVGVAVDGFLASTRNMLVTLAVQPPIKAQNADAATPMLADLLRANPHYANIWATRLDGWNYASALPPPQGSQLYIGDRQYFKDAMGGARMGIQSIPDNRQHPTRFAVVMAWAVRDDAGGTIGTVNAAFELLPLQEIVGQTADLPPGTMIDLVDESGFVIARSQSPEEYVGRSVVDSPLWAILAASRAGNFAGRFLDGEARLGAHTAIDSAPWQVIVGVPESAAYAQLWDAVLLQLAVLVIPILAAGYLALRLGQTAIAKSRALVQRDIAEAEIKRLNEDLERRVDERTAELTAANQELESFAYSVAHDLRAPLRHIDGFSQLLLKEYPDRLDDRGRQYLRFLGGASVKMGRLIDDLLKLSRVTRAVMHRQTVDLSELARAVAVQLNTENPGRVVDLTVAPGLQVEGDPQLLRIALQDLLGNAWKFTAHRPVARVEFGVLPGGADPVYFVKDDGVGFDMQYVARLFGPFQRLHAEREFPGTGIGLAAVQRVVQRHGGRVWAEGEVDKGATFYFTLP